MNRRNILGLLLGLTLAAAAPAAHAWKDRPLGGDPAHGEKLWGKSTRAKVRVNGAWINSISDDLAARGLQVGKGGFPKLRSDNPLDRYDVVAFVRSKNIDLRDLIPEQTSHMLVTKGVYDKYAVERLVDRAGLEKVDKEDRVHRVFVLYDMGARADDLIRVRPKQTKTRDKLKPKKKIGYAVVMPLKGLRDGGYEVGFTVDKDIRITGVEIVGPDGSRPEDLNRAAARLVGRGARGKYDGLRLVGAGKAVRELQDAISQAFLLGMEAVYMYEVKERDYFAFDVD